MSSTNHSIHTFAGAAEEFAQAWENPRHTRVTLPPVDVNKVLTERYRMDQPIHITRAMVWDMSSRRAGTP